MAGAGAKATELASNEPVTVAAIVRAAIYTVLVKLHVDLEIVGAIAALVEVLIVYVTRRAVTPVKRAAAREEAALRTPPPTAESQAVEQELAPT